MTSSKPLNMEQLWADSYLFGGNAEYLDELYDLYLTDPAQIDPSIRKYFDQFHQEAPDEAAHTPIKETFKNLAKQPQSSSACVAMSDKQFQVHELIRAFRTHGHYQASIDPLNLATNKEKDLLKLATYGLGDADMNTTFNAGDFAKLGQTSFKNILDNLTRIYAGKIGFEYMHISSAAEAQWLRARIEDNNFYQDYTPEDKLSILNNLIAANEFERFLANKYVGQKRFGLEGTDSLIPALNHIINIGGANPLKEVVIGMAHRGRLNVLANVIGKPIKHIIEEFDGLSDAELTAAMDDPNHKRHSGDVKYHLGYSEDVKTPHGVAHLTLAFNPSHLEFVNPVVEGSVRARQTRRGEQGIEEVMPILLHGDAAFAGQGIVLETINMSKLQHFSTGGTIHIIINNQVGFTTSDPQDSRSTEYCSDLAKMLEAPIIHVNSDDPEAVIFAAQLAFDYRMRFHKDVFIDLVGFRRLGHNEADEPSATQPLMYQAIKKHPATAKLYADHLIQAGVLTEADYKTRVKAYVTKMENGDSIPNTVSDHEMEHIIDWTPYLNQSLDQPVDTRIPTKTLQAYAKALDDAVASSMTIQPQVKKMLQKRRDMTDGKSPINWGYAEMLAYLSLLMEGTPIRLSGEDSQRGTFAHRHAVLHDHQTGEIHFPINEAAGDAAQMQIINSFLSEAGVLGFEYGYACSDPTTLVLWEAQFGDFANGAQVIIDQFISSAEQKWDRQCGLVMLLPHGYEGMGPEHSSARLERYLQLCAEDNMQVCVPSTPAQIYHLLRRQMIRPCRKPLIVMTPKSILRHPLAVSTFEELSDGAFQLLIPEIDTLPETSVTRVVLCAGKVYYDLLERRRQDTLDHIAIVRVEQLYPFPKNALTELLQGYKNAKAVIWCQEEPQNQGAWLSLKQEFEACLSDQQTLSFAGRAASASPAVGHAKLHKRQQIALVEQALGLTE